MRSINPSSNLGGCLNEFFFALGAARDATTRVRPVATEVEEVGGVAVGMVGVVERRHGCTGVHRRSTHTDGIFPSLLITMAKRSRRSKPKRSKQTRPKPKRSKQKRSIPSKRSPRHVRYVREYVRPVRHVHHYIPGPTRYVQGETKYIYDPSPRTITVRTPPLLPITVNASPAPTPAAAAPSAPAVGRFQPCDNNPCQPGLKCTAGICVNPAEDG